MKKLFSGEVATELLRQGKRLYVDASGSAIVQVIFGTVRIDEDVVSFGSKNFGIYENDVHIKISSVSGTVNYSEETISLDTQKSKIVTAALIPDFNLSQMGKITIGNVQALNSVTNATIHADKYQISPASSQIRVSKNIINGDETVIHESATTNLVGQSTDLSAWIATNVTIGPQLNALNITFGQIVDTVSAIAQHRIAFNSVVTATDIVRSQAIFKAGTKNITRIRLFNATDGDIASAWFNLSLGTVGTTTAGTSEIHDLGNGFYLCSVLGATTAATSVTSYVHICDADNVTSYAGDGTGTIYMSAYLLETNPISDVKTPILSNGTTLTRPRDKIMFPTQIMDQSRSITLAKLRMPFASNDVVSNQSVIGHHVSSYLGALYFRGDALISFNTSEAILTIDGGWAKGDLLSVCVICDRNNNELTIGASKDGDFWQWLLVPKPHDGFFPQGDTSPYIRLFVSTVYDWQLYDLTIFNTLGSTRNLESARQIVETDTNYGRNRNYHVFILGGQSNCFNGEGLNGTDVYPAGVKQLGRKPIHQNFVVPAVEPLENINPTSTRITFMRTFVDSYIASTGTDPRDILIIPAAQGSTGFANNMWNPGDVNYNDLVNKAKLVMNRYPNATLKGLLWNQGEDDAVVGGSAISNYASASDAMFSQIRIDIPRASSMKIVVGQLLPSRADTFPNYAAIEALQKSTPERIDNTAFASMRTPTLVTTTWDGLHYDAPAMRTMGHRYFAAWATL